MNGLFYKNATAEVFRHTVDPKIVHPKPSDAVREDLWAGRVYLFPLSATAIQKLNLAVSHRCYGVPNSITLQPGDLVKVGDITHTVVLPTPTFDGPLGSTGWDLLLVVS